MVVHGDFPLDPRVAREARAATAAGFEVDVIALRRRGEAAAERVDGIEVTRLPLSHRRGRGSAGLVAEYFGFTAAAAARLAVRSVRRRYDVVQIHNPPDFLVAAALVPKLIGSRVLFDVHDFSPDMFDMRFRGRRGAHAIESALRGIERWALRLSDAVITVPQPYRRELILRGVDPAKVAVVMNTVDESLLPHPPAPRTGDFRVVYHGSVTPHYGVDLIVDAMAEVVQHVDARLEIYGEGDALRAVEQRVRDLGLERNVAISQEFLAQEEVLRRIAGASVGVIPNRPTRLNRFALSSKLFEYVALGISVVAAGLPTLREHFDDGEVRFFDPGDSAALAAAILEVARNPAAAEARAEAARRRYEGYRWESSAATYVSILERLATR